jgi:hypothetical protein
MIELAMAERATIYLGKPITDVLRCLGEDYNENKSGRTSTVCERYLMIVSDEIRRMDFSRAEWMAILDANKGMTLSYGIPEGGAMLWANVQESPEPDEKWGIDRRALVKKMRALSTAGKLTLREVCDRFWSRSDLDTDEALVQSGVEVRKQERRGRQ